MRLRCLPALLAVAGLAAADTLTLRSGQTVEGSYLGGTARQIKMVVGDQIKTYDVDDVLSLAFEGVQAAAPAPAPGPAAAIEDESRKILRIEPSEAARVSAPAAPAAPAPSGTQLAAGTNITIRMIDGVDAKQARVGQTFRASVDDPVLLGEREVIPKGADAVTKLVELQEAGKIAGGGQLTLDLVSVTVNGRPVEVNSQSVTQAGESGKKDSAKVIGGTAALGTIIGAIAGGGKGAAVGALSGAAAGTAVRVITSGADVKIPSETRLTFTLQQPVRL
jgi:hypothetical protein